MPAQSKAQQRFMGMVHATQKGDMEAPSKEVEKAADSMTNKDAKDYASTSHKGLPNKKENMKITKERLKELVKEVMTEESEYQAFFQKALDKTGKSIPDMNDDEKKAFFNKIDSAWQSKGEKNEGNAFGAAVTDAKEKGEDEFEVGGETFQVEGVNEAGPGLWANIRAKQARGGTPARKGTKAHKDAVAAGKRINNEETVIEVGELPNATIPSSIKTKLVMAIDKIKDSKLNYNQKIQVIGQVMDSLEIDKNEFGRMSSKLKGTMESNIKEDRGPCWQGYKQVGMKDKGGRQVPNCVKESVNEAVSPKDMDKIKSAVEAASSFMGVGSELKKLGVKYTFATEPLAIYIVQPTPNNKVAIVNKKYASKPDFVVGDIAVGIMEGIVNEVKVGQMVKVDNPHWEGALGKKGPFRRKVKMIDGDNVFFTDGSNSSMKFVKESIESVVNEQLVPVDKKAVDAFFNKKDFEGKNLNSDGKVLKTVGVGSQEMFTHTPKGVKMIGKVTGQYAQSLVQYVMKNHKSDLV